jgi:microcin C transport system substrate-binding protein
VRNLRLVNDETGEPFRFEILIVMPTFERIMLPLVRNLNRLGIDARVRLVDETQYINRIRSFDFDMAMLVWGQSESPGNEQRDFWGSPAADAPGSRNYAGIKDPVVDALIDLAIVAPTREALVARIRALDRVLLWGHYVVPGWHSSVDRILFWDKFARPAIVPQKGVSTDTWWFVPEKAERLRLRTTGNGR